jgi:Acetyltransferase (GNAT) domain
MLSVCRYTREESSVWDRFIAGAKNGTFLFFRDYMDYHHERFDDHSLLFRENGRVVAVMPAAERDGVLSSHAGLTFGGIISDAAMTTARMLDIFEALLAHARKESLASIVYKRVPFIYHRLPSEEDAYALFRVGARLIRRDVSSTIVMERRLPYTKGRKHSLAKAARAGLVVSESSDFDAFMELEEQHLGARYGVRPVHTSSELAMLAQRFPAEIRLFTVRDRNDELLGGVVVYDSGVTAHAQYIGATANGRACGAIDVVIDHLLTDVFRSRTYFDFGISTEDDGRYLNRGLIANKESYGARAVAYDWYEMVVAP